MSFPGIYPDENSIIPYSPRKRFGFMSPSGKIIELDQMKNISIERIVDLYKEGYRIDNIDKIATAQNGIYIGSGALFLIGIALLAYFFIKK